VPGAEPTAGAGEGARLLGALLGAALGGLGLLVARGAASPLIVLFWALAVAWILGDDWVDRRTHPRVLTPTRLAALLLLLGIGLWCLCFGHDWALGPPSKLDTAWVVFPLDAMAPGLLGLGVLGLVFRVNVFAGGPLDMNRARPTSGS
jgi:hypothetical protein